MLIFFFFKEKKRHSCSHDNSLLSGFLPPSERQDQALKKYVSKREPEKLFKEQCII